jgi:hypothetical protein
MATIESAEIVEVKAAAMRLRHYLAERARMGGVDFEQIHGVHVGEEDREAHLTAADLVTVLDALGDVAAVPGPPYGVGDDVSFLTGHNWHIGKVTSIIETGPGEWGVVATIDGKVVTATVNAQGVGGGIAPLRQH